MASILDFAPGATERAGWRGCEQGRGRVGPAAGVLGAWRTAWARRGGWHPGRQGGQKEGLLAALPSLPSPCGHPGPAFRGQWEPLLADSPASHCSGTGPGTLISPSTALFPRGGKLPPRGQAAGAGQRRTSALEPSPWCRVGVGRLGHCAGGEKLTQALAPQRSGWASTPHFLLGCNCPPGDPCP